MDRDDVQRLAELLLHRSGHHSTFRFVSVEEGENSWIIVLEHTKEGEIEVFLLKKAIDDLENSFRRQIEAALAA
jgi:hypothetical protein